MPSVVLPVLLVFRLVGGIMFAAAMGALAAVAAVTIGGSRADWLRPLLMFAVTLAAAFGSGAIGMFLALPATPELVRRPSRGARAAWPTPFFLLLAALGALALLQAVSILSWWRENQPLVQELAIEEPDPLGFNLVAAALVYLAPAIGSLCVLSSLLTSVLVLAVPADFASRALGACTVVQGGLVFGLLAIERYGRDLGAAIQQLVNSSADPALSTRVADWLARYEGAGGTNSVRLALLFGGYLLALAASWALVPRRTPLAGSIAAPRVEDRPLPPRPAAAPAVPVVSVASASPVMASDFGGSDYSVQPRKTSPGSILWSNAEYDIGTIPPMSRERWSLSWRTGMIRREPDGPDLFSVRTVREGGVFGRVSYLVADARSGSEVGAVVPTGIDWDVRDPSGASIAQVLRKEEAPGHARYVAVAGDREVCRFVWGFVGITIASAELQIEFLPGADDRIKTLGIVLGPILEHQSRRSAQRRS